MEDVSKVKISGVGSGLSHNAFIKFYIGRADNEVHSALSMQCPFPENCILEKGFLLAI
jgi:hypothetical protein